MADSMQHKLDKIRPPRVHITYDVEVGDAVQQKEIPFVVGVLGDFSGNPEEPLPPMKDRKFIEIDKDNFNSVLDGMNPRLQFSVENCIEDNDTKMAVELNFNSIDDFHPENIAQQVEPLKKLAETRKKLFNLLGKLDGNEKLESLLQDVISHTDQLEQIAAHGQTDESDKDQAEEAAEQDK